MAGHCPVSTGGVQGLKAGWSIVRGHIREAMGQGFRWLSRPKVRHVIMIGLTLMAMASLVILLRANWGTLASREWRVRPVPLALSFVAYSVALGMAIWAWGQIMNTLGTPVRWRQHIRIYCITNLARRLPGVLWHVVGRVALYDEKEASKTVISVGSGLELILTALSGLGVGIMAWPGSVDQLFHPMWIVGGLALGLLAVHPRVLHVLLTRLGVSVGASGELRYRQVLGWLLIYGLIWLMGGLVLFALIETIYPVSLEWLPRTVGAWSLSGMVAVVAAVLPVGLGFRELTLSLLLATFLPEGIALVTAILSRLLLTLYELIWALITHWGAR